MTEPSHDPSFLTLVAFVLVALACVWLIWIFCGTHVPFHDRPAKGRDYLLAVLLLVASIGFMGVLYKYESDLYERREEIYRQWQEIEQQTQDEAATPSATP